MIDGRTQFTELQENESPKKQTNYCFCKGVTSAKTIFFFSGVTPGNPCTQMNCYEKYVYAAEKYVMKAPIEGTPLFQLTFESRGSYSDPQAWTRTCCDATSDDCAISSNGASSGPGLGKIGLCAARNSK